MATSEPQLPSTEASKTQNDESTGLPTQHLPTTQVITENAEASGTAIEADDSSDPGATSDYPESVATSTTSLSPSVTDYIYENGRRYQRQGAGSLGTYASPNDEVEQDRLDMSHHAHLLIMGGRLHMAPIKNVHRVLDCGTGTGIWALDFGDVHPEAEVTGVDISPIQPSWTFPNVKFEVDDIEKDWTWPENHFDFIHSRMIINGIHDWSRFMRQCFKHCKPGGYVEVSEYDQRLSCDDGTFAPNTALFKYFEKYLEFSQKAGLNFPRDTDIERCMADAGFVNIKIHRFYSPWGPWPKNRKLRELGHVNAATLETGLESYAISFFTNVGGMAEADARKLCQDAFKDIMSRKVHGYNWCWQIVGQKPE